MIIIGLTGSIGMGKSTCGAMLEQCGVPVHESDHAVHDLLSGDDETIDAVIDAFPSLSRPINRADLGAIIFHDKDKREMLESILHPRVQDRQNAFIKAQRAKGLKIVALDIPLLFETSAETRTDYTAVASAPFHIQSTRVLNRPDMTEDKFANILARQMPDSEKRKRADFILPTGLGKAETMKAIKKMLAAIKEDHHARSRS